MGTDLRDAARQALEALEICAVRQEHQWHGLQQVQIVKAALRTALEQPERPNFTLSCGCPSQYGGVPAYWERDGSTAFGMICEKHWHEYGARNEA